MSIKLMTMVWDLDLPHDQQSIMLALADHADDDGHHCYPSVAYVAWKCGYSERAVQRILRKLENAELITVKRYRKGGRGHATEYRVQPWKGAKKPPFIRENKGDELTPIKEERVPAETQRVPNGTERVTPRPPQPSVNHQETKEPRDPSLSRFWVMTLEGVSLPDKLAHDVARLTPRSWADGVLTLHAPADVQRRLQRRTGELLERLQPVAPVPLVEVVIVNGG